MSLVKNIYEKLVTGDIKDTESTLDVDEWIAFLGALPEPRDEIDLSYNKYRCRKRYIPKPKLVLLNAAAVAMLVKSMPAYVGNKRAFPVVSDSRLVLVDYRTIPHLDILPSQLVERFDILEKVPLPTINIRKLSAEAKREFAACAKRHPLSFYYLYYVLKEFAIHCSIINDQNPKAVAIYANERNLASPLLRRLYEDSGRELNSFMHGEFLLQLIQSFSSFTNYYVWDECYTDMFRNTLKWECGSFIVYTPERLKKKWHLEDVVPDHFCTYYYSGESAEAIRKTQEIIAEIEATGRKCLVRPHPRYSHRDLIEECFRPDQIEWPAEVSLEESLGSTQYVIGLTSTVLTEALVEGREVVIDDLADPVYFNSLEKRRFRLLKFNPPRLSDFLAELP